MATGTRTKTRTDERIKRDVLAELKRDARVQPNEIGVVVKDGIVALTGWVDSYLKKDAAEEAAHRLRDVKAVANDIEVRPPGAAEPTDEDLARAAVEALESDASVPTQKIDLTVSAGSVTLTGEVGQWLQRQEAERVVRRLSRVSGVINKIIINPRLAGSELKEKVEQALARSAAVDPQRIAVEVQGSRVILKGTVYSWREREEVEQAAWSAPGVTWVQDRIQISPY
jgi:osmotically-inducible protein OsmY